MRGQHYLKKDQGGNSQVYLVSYPGKCFSALCVVWTFLVGGICIMGGLHGKNGPSARVQPCDEDPFSFSGAAVTVIRYIRAHFDWEKIYCSLLFRAIAEATVNQRRSKELSRLIF